MLERSYDKVHLDCSHTKRVRKLAHPARLVRRPLHKVHLCSESVKRAGSFLELTENQSSLRSDLQPLITTLSSDLLLQLGHALLIAKRISGIGIQSPRQVVIGVVSHEVGTQDAQPLSIVGHLSPVTTNILQVTTEVRERPLKNLPVDRSTHDRLHVHVLLESAGGFSQNVVCSALDGPHEFLHFLRVGGQEGVVGNVQDRAEAAASELGELVDAQHLHVVAGPALLGEPFSELDHLDVLEADTRVNIAADDGFGYVHAAPDGGVVVGGHAVVFGEFVDLDLGVRWLEYGGGFRKRV